MPTLAYDSEAEWHEIRSRHVGGSEIACLFYDWTTKSGGSEITHLWEAPPDDAVLADCLSPYKTGFRLWQEKAGRLRPDDFSENERVEAGTHLEPALAAWAQSKWPEWKLRKVRRYLQHTSVEGWGSSLDYESVETGMPPVEFKNVDWLIWRDHWMGADDEPVPPIHINLQLQAQIGVTKATHGWIVACVGGNSLHRIRIERHEPTQQRIAEAVSLFWASVHDGREPTFLADYDTAKSLHQFGDKAQALDFSGEATTEALARRYVRIKRHADFTDRMLDAIKARLASRLGTATRATGTDISITWPVITRPAKEIPARRQEELTYRGGLTVKIGAKK